MNNTRAENKNTASDADTAESTSVNTDPAEHTPAEQAVIEEYQNAVDNRLLSWLERVKGSLAAGDKTAQKMKIVLSAVTDRTAMAVKDVSGIDVTGFSHMMDGSAVIHIEKRHGENGKHDKSMRNVEDIARAQYVLDNFDTCELITDENEIAQLSSGFMDKNNNPAPVVRFSKKVNGTYYVAEAVPDSADKKMHIISAYMQKNKGSIIQALNIEDNSSQQHTSETPLDPIASSTPIISDVAGNSNSASEVICPLQAIRDLYKKRLTK